MSHNNNDDDDYDDASRSTTWPQPPTRAEWEEHKFIIEELYIRDNMTLEELMEVMRTRCNFHATYGTPLSFLLFFFFFL